VKPRSYFTTKKIITSSVLLFFFMFSLTKAKEFVQSGNFTRILPLTKEIGDTLDEVRCSIGELILTNSNTTIEYPGLYILGQDIPNGIHVTVGDVVIDLNGYTVIDQSGASHGILIDENLKNIFIKNGALQGSGKDTSTTNGIWIKDRTELVKIQDVNIYGFNKGMYLDGLSSISAVKSCSVIDCSFYDNDKGAVLNYVRRSVFENCEALNCVQAGYELYHCRYNSFYQCIALETINSSPTEHAIGFSIDGGLANLFLECVANGTEKTSSNFGYNATGFLLKGDATHDGEKRTELVKCIASRSKAADDGNAYGIHFDATLKDAPFDALVTSTDGPSDANVVDWSPECDFIAVGYNYTNTAQLRMFNLDSGTLVLFSMKEPNDKDIKSVAWSPRGEYLAAGSANNSGGNEFFMYKFNPRKPSLSYLEPLVGNSKSLGGDVNSISWHPESRYIAVGLSTDATSELQIWGFENDALGSAVIDLDTSSSDILDVEFSPDGKYVATITGATLKIYSFNPLIASPLTLMVNLSGAPLYGGSLKSINWSPIACGQNYLLALGGTDSSSKNIQVLHYDGSASVSGVVTQASLSTSAHINSVKWSPNGRYLLTGGNSSGEPDAEIFIFDATAPSLISSGTGDLPGGPVNSVDWNSGGSLSIIVGQETSGDSLAIFSSANAPYKCVAKYCEVLSCEGGLCGIGMEGPSSCHLLIRNIGYENDINFSEGVFNTYKQGLNGSPLNLDNVSFPPYED